MLRALTPYLIVSFVIAGVAGWLYGDGTIGVLATYGLSTLATVVIVAGYVRWDEQHYR